METVPSDEYDDNNINQSFEETVDGNLAMEDTDEGIDDASSLGKARLKENLPAPLIRQIKQEVIEDSINNEKLSYKPTKTKPAILSQRGRPKKPRKEKITVEKCMDGNDPPDIIDVTCGHLRGKLHKELFYCPGIHRACVELDDGTFVTPKRFMFMGEKARLKDWKNAIRWNGHQLRKHIEAGTLAFHKHHELCTGRCFGRSPFAAQDVEYQSARSKLRKEKFEFETLGFSTDAGQLDTNGLHINEKNINFVTTVEENGCMKIQSVSGNDHQVWQNIENDKDEQEEPPDIKPDIKQLQQQMMKTMQPKPDPVQILPREEPKTNNIPVMVSNYNYKYEPIKKVPSVLPPSIMHAMMPPVSESDSTKEEDRLLWQGIVELGLIDEFFREIKASLDLLKNTMVKRLVPVEDSNRISIIVRQLGLMQKLKFKLEAHRTDMDRQKRRLDREMMDLQKKVKEYEHKKMLLERKTECFDQILEIPAIKKNPAVPMMMYPNQSTSVSQDGQVILTSQQSSQTPISSNVVSQSSASILANSSKIMPGSRVLVFPKQSTQFHSSPEGGLKITLKRKQELHDEEAPSAKQKESSQLNDVQSKSEVGTNTFEGEDNMSSENLSTTSSENETLQQISTNHSADREEKESLDLPIENSHQDELNSSYEELNSSHEENYSASGDCQIDDKNENLVKRSRRKRSLKTYDDYIK